MSDTNLYWRLRGSYRERIEKIRALDREFLEAAILDREYNDFLRDRADYREGDSDLHGYGKRLPYVGWFWRHLEFSDGNLPIGDSGDMIGFMANNKWDYPERDTTPEEFAIIMGHIDAAMKANEQGGNLAEIRAATMAELDKLWDYVQTLKV